MNRLWGEQSLGTIKKESGKLGSPDSLCRNYFSR